MKNFYKVIFVVYICISISSCTMMTEQQPQNQNGLDDPVSILLDAEYKTVSMNTSLGLQFFEFEPELVNDFKINSNINFLIKNSSTDNIWFFSQDDIKIYVLVDKRYINVNDQIGRNLDEPISIPSGLELPLAVNPIVDSEKSVEVLIVVTGRIMDGEKTTDEIVGAYIKCTLDP